MQCPSRSRIAPRRVGRRAPVRPSARPSAVERIESRVLLSGTFDPSWNGGGELSIAVPSGATASTTIISVQRDERVLVGSTFTTSGGVAETSISRRTAQGNPDTTFAGGGSVTVPFKATSLTVTTSGQVLVAGPSLERLNQDGGVDTTFGNGTGIVSLAVPMAGVVEQTDGKIVVSGTTSSGQPQVTRYNANGTVDTSFGSSGTKVISILGGGAATYTAGAVALTSSDQIVVSLAINGNTSVGTFGLVRLTTAGQFDTSFGSNGVSEVLGYGAPDVTGGMVIDSAGTIYQVGTYYPGTTSSVGYLMAYSADGTHANISPMGGLDTTASDVTLQPHDNKPIVIGTAVQHSGTAKHTVLALDRFYAVNPDAPVWVPDPSFGGAGLVTVSYNGPNALDSLTVGDLGQSVYEMPNGNIVIGGTSINPGSTTTSANVTRLVGDASLAYSVANITGTVYFDQNFNGTRDPNDTGLAGRAVFIDANNNGVYDTGELQVYSDANGKYVFSDMAPGTYHIVQVVVPGLTHTTPQTSVTASYTETVSAHTTTSGKDFGLTGVNSLSGTVFTDTNANGAKDAGETGLAGVTVYLDLDGSGTLTSADTSVTTDSSGNFTFTHLPATTYLVRAVVTSGHTFTTSLPLSVTIVGTTSSTGNLIGET